MHHRRTAQITPGNARDLRKRRNTPIFVIFVRFMQISEQDHALQKDAPDIDAPLVASHDEQGVALRLRALVASGDPRIRCALPECIRNERAYYIGADTPKFTITSCGNAV